ncbi:MAG: hypothetical protein ACW98K_17975 [Candidatus Kariarchaeaceae archaeon]
MRDSQPSETPGASRAFLFDGGCVGGRNVKWICAFCHNVDFASEL